MKFKEINGLGILAVIGAILIVPFVFIGCPVIGLISAVKCYYAIKAHHLLTAGIWLVSVILYVLSFFLTFLSFF